MYAILDIETTGGKYNEEGITEIAIYRFDGHRIIDQFASLINPERPIQPFVINLTGINNEMLRQAPKFYEVAKRIIEITDGCVMVAHNALFDNRILATEFDRLGYTFEKQTLCTVELSKKLLPDMPSYSLGKLVRSLGIPLSDRHRAQGDAKATVALFKMLLSKDTSKEIIAETLKQDTRPQLDSSFFHIIEQLPSETGLFYMHNKQGKIIYIGRSNNIKKKVFQHLTNENRRSKLLQAEVSTITYEKTGSELISLLKEYEELKRNKPKFNKIPKSAPHKFQISSSVDNEGFINLQIDKTNGKLNGMPTFRHYTQAMEELRKLTEENKLCPKFTGILDQTNNCDFCGSEVCLGACKGEEAAVEYNSRVKSTLENYSFYNKSFLLIDKGRETEERSVIWFQNGIYKGFAFYNLNYQLNNPDVLKSIITPSQFNGESRQIIQNYLLKKRVLKIIKLSS